MSRIKGITIEIGGDTTKLDKALKGTNSEIKDTQSQLKEVEKHLKLDPQNVILLEQKQRLLAQATESTKEKFNILQQAAQNADQALANQTEWSTKYEPLKKQLDETKAKLDELRAQDATMKAQLESGEISAGQYQAYQTELTGTREKMKELQTAIKELDASFAAGHIDQREYDALQRDLIAAAKAAEQAEKESKELNSTLGKVAKGAKDAGAALGDMASAVGPMSMAAGGVAAGLVAVVESTKDLRREQSFLTQNLRESSISGQVASEAMKKLAAVTGGDTSAAMKTLNNLLAAGFDETAIVNSMDLIVGAYATLPDTIKIDNLAESIRTTIDTGQAAGQFATLLKQMGVETAEFNTYLGYCATETDRVNMVMSQLSAGGLGNAAAAWQENNGALIEYNVAQYEMQQNMAKLADAIQPFINEGLAVLLDIVSKVVNAFAGLDEGTQRFILTLIMLLASLAPILSMASNVANIFGSFSSKLGAVGDVADGFAKGAGNSMFLTFVKWAAIITAVVAAVTLLIAMINILTGKGDQMERSMNAMGGAASGASGGGAQGGMGNMTYARNATGTPYSMGGPTLVGENGPELVNMPRGSRVFSADDTRSLFAGNQQPQQMNLSLTVTAKDGLARDLAFQVDKASQLRGVKLVQGV